MATRDDNNLIFVQEIEKYEYLYNFNMPEYARKELTDRAWGEIGKKMGLSINECKEKWRNIRSAFLRSLKCVDGKVKRRYYLHDDLKFVVPYTKPHQSTTIQSNSPETSEYHNPYVELYESNAEDSHMDQDEKPFVAPGDHFTKADSPITIETQTQDDNLEHANQTPRKHLMTREMEHVIVDYLKHKKRRVSKDDGPPTLSPIQHFFMSLKPDIDTMTEDQVLRFKIEVLHLIDKIKKDRQD